MSAPSSVLYNFRLLSALRSDDPAQVQPFLDEAAKSGPAQTGVLLGMAVRVGTSETSILTELMAVPIIQSILALPNIDVNAPVAENSRSTALHIAAESGRTDAGETS